MSRNIRLYPWFQFFKSLLFWQGVWFLFFQRELSAADAILLYVIFDIATIALEVPSGYLSDRVGRRFTLILAATTAVIANLLLAFGTGLPMFALAQIFLGASIAFVSGTDSALLYESLAHDNRTEEVEMQELVSWRFSFTALAVSALIGGVVALDRPTWAFLATAISAAIAIGIATRLREPVHDTMVETATPLRDQARAVGEALRIPVLAWFFVLSGSMYVFSHVPFVFGQPFILDALQAVGLAGEAPAVSGAVTAGMMLISVASSWVAMPLHRLIGIGALLLLALSLQVGLITVLAASIHPIAIAILLLRMVPDALARPFVIARVQPFLDRRYRATYWSFQSLIARLFLAATLYIGSLTTTTEAALSHSELQDILVWYIVAGVAVLAGLVVTIKLPGKTE